MKAGRAKYRPSIRTIVLLMLVIAVMTPMIGLFFFRVFENQLIRKTEAELIGQTAALAAAYRLEIERAKIGPDSFGAVAPVDVQAGYKVAFSPYGASLDLARDPVLPPRPDPQPAAPLTLGYGEIGNVLEPVIEETRRRTLAGLQLLDPHGTVMTGSEVGTSLAHVPELQEALNGRLARQLRTRLRDRPPPLVYYVTKGASLRVFIAFPVIVSSRVAGVVYASRTPAHVMQVAWAERRSLALAAAATLGAVLLFGLIAARAVTGPIRALTTRTRAIASGDRSAMRPLDHSGTREIGELSDIFLRTSRKLHDRSDDVAAFAAHVSHELKSPLTAIQGAAELILDAGEEMTAADRQRFISNIVDDTTRMTALVRSLLDLARAETDASDGTATLPAIIAALQDDLDVYLTGETDIALGMAPDRLSAILTMMADNAARHGARRWDVDVTVEDRRAKIRVTDDGEGISEGNRERLFEPFFTTRRAEGGTGMGLPIAKALVEAHDGSIRVEDSQSGAAFTIELPVAA
ncbi:MAG: HAMP domain-containing sensor histidine kinase [Pseudomonadota bacterium]